MATGPNMMQLKSYINYGNSGFAYDFNLGYLSYAAAEPVAVLINNAIARTLPSGFGIAHSVLSDLKVLRDSMVVNGYTLYGDIMDAEVAFATDSLCNDPEVSFLVRFTTGLGKYANRQFRALRDDAVVDNTKVTVFTAPYAVNGPYMNDVGAGPVYAAGDAAADVWANLFSIIRDKTVLLSPSTQPSGAVLYYSYSFTGYAYRRISSHDVGKRFAPSSGKQANWS